MRSHPTPLALRSTFLAAVAVLASTSAAAQDDGPPVAPAPTPEGYAIDESQCASGGPTTYFFKGGKVIKVDCGDECPFIMEGTWSMEGEAGLSASFTTAWVGKGKTIAPGPMPSRTMYTDYAAEVRPIQKAETWLWQGDDGCAVTRKHDQPAADVRAILKGKWAYQHPELATRALTAAELEKRSLEELGKMRNEIFAAYGYRFKNAELAAWFEGFPGYRPTYVDVTAFLSPLEKQNAETIKGVEAQKKKADPKNRKR